MGRILVRGGACPEPRYLGSYSMVRVWNGVPGILDEASNLRDRYMVFNAGRCAAFDAWFGAREADAFAAAMPAATGVGHASGDLSIHVLADKQPGVAVENPRQQSAFRYSRRYGPQPPCFSRATRLVGPAANNEEYVLLSGTASMFYPAVLCRESLQVEIEGLAVLS